MSCPSPSRHHLAAFLLLLPGLAGWTAPACLAAQSAPAASVVIDADTGEVLHANNANLRVRPASLTKLMTALLVMQDLADGKQVEQDKWPVSSAAAAQPATRLGLRSGRELAVTSVLDAVLVVSANDAALVAAEGIAGDEASFVRRMNETASSLGMTRTRFANPSGLPASHFTTARDIAVLARYLWRSFPDQRKRFSQTGITHAGRWRGTTNPLLGSYPGALGMKTGFTCRAGFHLVGAVERDGRTLIAVVLGATAADGRARSMRKLLDEAFASRPATTGLTVTALGDSTGQGENLPVSTSIIATSCLAPKRPTGWNIDVGVKRSRNEARALARDFIRAHALGGAGAISIPRFRGVELHRAIVTGLNEDKARAVCLGFREQGGSCIIFGPDAAAAQLKEIARVRALVKAARAAKAEGSSD